MGLEAEPEELEEVGERQDGLGLHRIVNQEDAVDPRPLQHVQGLHKAIDEKMECERFRMIDICLRILIHVSSGMILFPRHSYHQHTRRT